MPTNSPASGAANPNANTNLLSDLRAVLAAGWHIHVELMPNPLGAVSYALLIFNNPNVEQRAPRDEFDAVKSGEAPTVQVRMQVDLFDPDSLPITLQRFRATFVTGTASGTAELP